MALRRMSLLLLLLLATTALPAPAEDNDDNSDDDDDNNNNDANDDNDDDNDDDNNDDDDDDDDDDDEGGDGPNLEEYGITGLEELLSDSRNLVLGWRQYGDSLLFEENFRRRKRFGRLHDVHVRVPRGNATITHVVARFVGTGGGATRAVRRGGGVGASWLHLKLRAPRGFGLEYEVKVYGR